MHGLDKIDGRSFVGAALGAMANAIGHPSKLMPQLSRYAAASVLSLAIDFATYLALCEMGLALSRAGIAGYATGMLVSYVLSSRFVFDTTLSQKSEARRVTEFVLSGLVGLTVTGVVIEVLTQSDAATPILAKSVAAAVSFAAVFAIRRSFVFAV